MKTHKVLFLVLITFNCCSLLGQITGSLEFNGFDNYISLANNPLREIGNSEFTLEAWVKGKGEQEPHPMIFSNRTEGDINNGILFFFHNKWGDSKYKMLAFQYNGYNYFLVNNGTHNASILDGNCHHVAIVKKNDKIHFYIDGKEAGTRNIKYPINLLHNNRLLIGKDEITNNTFNGSISQCRIWNIARTESQIRSTMNVRLEGNEIGLLSYWEMNELSGQVINDKSGDYDGTLGENINLELSDPIWSFESCIGDNQACSFFKVSPNPTRNDIEINYEGSALSEIKVYSSNGSLLNKVEINGTINLKLNTYPPGIYFIQLNCISGSFVRKVIKI